MKNRVLLSLLVIALAAALVGGATMAWFNAEAEVPEATFTAGTVAVNVDDPDVTPMEGRFVDNINPGDCATVEWNIINEGTKKAQLRVKLNGAWVEELSADNVFFAPAPDSNWVMYEEEDGLWLYYVGAEDGVAGTYGDVDPTSIPLPLVIAFDGEATDNDYQGATFEIGGIAEAVQATNGAPAAVWGEVWNEVNADGYTSSGENLEYFLTGAGNAMKCWTGETQVVDPDPDPELEGYDVSNWKVNYVCNGATITAKIEALDENDNTYTSLNGEMTVLHGIKYRTYWNSKPATTDKNVDVTFVNGKANFTVTWTGTIHSITDRWIVIDGKTYK